ncbi:MAG: ribonuclease P protein component [Actinomycetia bacterium]|nr:ribonuclease P protein component [Actinomycetes bacterium]MCP4960820.1 ribonuclease P protein component [Actinomycetes bacterium]
MTARCRTRSDFRRLEDEGRRKSGRHIWVRSVIDDEVRPPRVAFAVGRRNGNAVTRNRIKRRLRAAIQRRDDEIPGGIHLVGWKRSSAKGGSSPGAPDEPSFDQLLEDIDTTLSIHNASGLGDG